MHCNVEFYSFFFYLFYSYLADEGREEALSGSGLDLLIFPGMGFTKVGHC